MDQPEPMAMVKRVPFKEGRGYDPQVTQLQDATRDALRPLQKDQRSKRDIWQTPTDQTPTTVTAETPIFIVDNPVELQAIKYVGSAAMAKNGTDYATFIFRTHDGSGAGQAKQIARTRTADVDIRAFQAFDFPLSGERHLSTGTIISMEVTKAGAGRSVTWGHVGIFYNEV
jgi:hypothetical protein